MAVRRVLFYLSLFIMLFYILFITPVFILIKTLLVLMVFFKILLN